jgi:hypothetical protein
VVAALVGVSVIFPLLASPHRIDETHFRLIASGMSEAEVEAVFGVPAGEYDWAVSQLLSMDELIVRALASADVRPYRSVAGESIDSFKTWTSRHGSFRLWFDDRAKVMPIIQRGEVRIEPPWQRWWHEHLAK